MHVALYQPQIPGNTGTIGRMCVGLDAHLHIIGPCAFDFSDSRLKRAGLDYWPHLKWTVYPDPAAFLEWLGDRQPWLVTKFGVNRYDQPAYGANDVIILGNEVRGIPDEWHARWPDRGIHIPILGKVRSFNLSATAAVVVTQACLKSGRFDGMGPKER
jgi:tRNA (cytidine/uridine-2'-O-)-methyltransferase